MTDQRFPDDDRSDRIDVNTGDSFEEHSSADLTGPAFGAGVDEAAAGGAKRKRSRSKATRKKSSRKASRKRSAAKEESADESDQADAEGSDSGPRTKKRRSRRTKRAQSSDAADGAPAGDDGDEKPKRKRSSRKRRSKKKSSRSKASTADDAEPSDDAGEDSTDGGAKKKRRRRGSRGGRRRKKTVAPAIGIEAIPGEEDDLPDLPELPPDTELLTDEKPKSGKRRGDGKSERKKSRRGEKKGEKKSKKAEKKSEPVEVKRDQIILVNAIDREEKRVAVVSDGRIDDLLMTSESQKTLVNDIYRGKVVNMEPAIGAAFVDFGQGRNGFLHTSDVLTVYGKDGFSLQELLTTSVDPDDWDGADDIEASSDNAEAEKPKKSSKRSDSRRRSRKRLPITDLLRVGDPVVVQITKDAIGDKGPTLTTYISIPGRYLVLMPSMSRTGVSRKIPDEKERRRLKRILSSLDAPADMGVIVRTAGVGKKKADLQRDLQYLLGVWQTFGKRLKGGRGPVPLYQESEVAIRTMRDLFNERTEAVIVDDPMVHEQLIEFAEKLMPEHVDRIKLHDGDRPIFHHHGIEQDFERIFVRRAELPSGGSIVFDQTEALVAIDVNSGRTRTDGFDFEEIALKTNLEAVPEIARQIRLRDLGGIIVCDFIDMMRSSSMRTVERALRKALDGDRARSKIGRISQFGLLEMTRQRLGPGTHKKVFQACSRCRGTGRIRTVPSRAAGALRRLGSALTQKGFTSVEVRLHPEVVEYMQEELHDYVRALEHRFEKELKLTPVPDQPEDSVLRYLRADGREVRPGGRRRR